MPSTSILSRVRLVLIGFCTSFLVSCCQKVTIPQTSTTPPGVVMLAGVENKNDTVTTTAVNEVIQSADSPIGLIGIAGDDQGVRDVELFGDVDTTCVSGNIGQVMSLTYLVHNPDNSQPGQQGCTLRMTGLNVVPSAVRCGSAFSRVAISGEFNTSGSNFSNGTVSTAVYSFSVVSTARTAMKPEDLRKIPTQKPCVAPHLKHLKGLKKISCIEVELPQGVR